MRIYISGISGTGMGPLALMAKAAGMEVCGSDLARGAIYDELVAAGIEVFIGEQDGKFLQEKLTEGVDWFAYTSALPETHTELMMAREAGVKCTKRDDLTAYLVDKLGLKMVAVAGTHGKTTTTSMIVWASLQLGLPVSYMVGTTLGFAPSGIYHKGDRFFVYEADEYDRNFLKYHPWLAVIPSVSYDHPDIYPSREEYAEAFLQFERQSEMVIKTAPEMDLKIAGAARRKDAALAIAATMEMVRADGGASELSEIAEVMERFPGVGRRFEQIAEGLYSDYAHHPEEIAATIDVALDECKLKGRKGVVVVYQPHQNTRQYEVREGYRWAFDGAEKVYWLPTYLTRENPELSVILPAEFITELKEPKKAEVAELNDELEGRIREYLQDGYLVVLMTAGPADSWLREKFEEKVG